MEVRLQNSTGASLESLSNDNGRRQRERQKTIDLDCQNNNFAHASRFLYISWPLLYDYDVKMSNFKFCRGHEHKRTTFFFFSWTSIQSFRIQLQKHLPKLDELNEMELA